MSKRASLKDIADSLGISRGTVDRAIHNRGRINPETRDRVLAEARRLGYIDRKIESFLPLRQKKTIETLIPGDDPFFEKIEAGLRRAVANGPEGIELEIRHISLEEPDAEKKRLDEIRNDPGDICAVIIVPSDRDFLNPVISRLEERGIPVVTVNTDAPGSGRSVFIGQDLYASGRVAGEILLQICDGPILVLSGFERIWAHEERLRGFFDICRENGREKDIIGPFFMHDRTARAYSILSEHSGKYDGVYTVSGQATEGAGSFLAANRLDLPLIGYDCTETNRKLLKAGSIRSLIYQSPELQGYLAVRWLIMYLMENSPPANEKIQAPIDIYFRENIDFFKDHSELI